MNRMKIHPLRASTYSVMCRLVLVLLSLGGVAEVKAQYTLALPARSEQGVLRPAFAHEARTVTASPRLLRLPELGAGDLPREDVHRRQGLRTYQFAVERPLDLGADSIGEYLTDGVGNYVWRAELVASRARSVSLRLRSRWGADRRLDEPKQYPR